MNLSTANDTVSGPASPKEDITAQGTLRALQEDISQMGQEKQEQKPGSKRHNSGLLNLL